MAFSLVDVDHLDIVDPKTAGSSFDLGRRAVNVVIVEIVDDLGAMGEVMSSTSRGKLTGS